LIEQVLHETINTPALENAIGAKAMLVPEASEQLWADVAGLTLEDLNLLKQELEHQGVLSNAEFAHPLFREVIAHGLQPEKRQGFARRALEVLKNDPRAAAEFVEDANLEAGDAFLWFQKASKAASEAGDKIHSTRFKARAVEYVTGKEKGKLALDVAQELRLFDLSESAKMADIALKFQPKNEEAVLLRVELLAIQGSMIDSQEMLKRLSDDKQAGEKWLILQLKLCFSQNDHVRMLKICQEHPELLETTDPGLCWNISFLLSASGDNNRAMLIAERGLAQPELTLDQHGSLLMPCGIILSNRGDYLGAERLFTQAISLFQQTGRLRSLSAAYFNRAFVSESLSNYRGMTADLMEVIKLYTDLGDVIHVAYAQAMFGGALIPFAEFDRAEELLLESRNILKRMGVSPYLVVCETQLSLLYLNWRSAHSEVLASKYALSALEHTRSLGDPLCILESLFRAAEVLISNGDGFRGFELSEEMFELLETIDVSKDRGNAYLIRAKALEVFGQRDEALDAFHRAVELINVPLSIQTARLEIDRLTNNLDGARVRLAWFEERGLKNGVNIALRYFPELASSTASPSSTTETSLQLEVLGSMQITLEAQTTPVRGRKRQELLALLLEARISGRGEVSKLELVDKLYPDADEIQANAGLRDVIYQIRSSLGENAITTTANGYALGSLKTDVETFLETGNTQLWRGVYLEGLTLETSDTVRESLYLALRTRAEALLETEPLEAIRVAKILCEADPYDLEAVRVTVTGLRAGQNHRSLTRFYDSARTRFLEIGEVLPDRWQDFLSSIGTTA
jgi:tetratricopeptide (TPR) repeat protein